MAWLSHRYLQKFVIFWCWTSTPKKAVKKLSAIFKKLTPGTLNDGRCHLSAQIFNNCTKKCMGCSTHGQATCLIMQIYFNFAINAWNEQFLLQNYIINFNIQLVDYVFALEKPFTRHVCVLWIGLPNEPSFNAFNLMTTLQCNTL